MGTPKPLLQWGGQTLIEYQLSQLAQPPVDHVVVVLGHRAEALRPFVEAACGNVVVNELYSSRGRASSLRAGAGAVADDARTVLVLHVDQPRPHALIERLIEAHQRLGKLITVPTFEGRRGHPTVLDGWLIPELRTVHERTQGLRAVLLRYAESVAEAPFESDVVLLDLNTPEDYARAKAAYFQTGAEVSQ